MHENVPQSLRELPQWVLWKFQDRPYGKPSKIPVNARTGQNASANNPATWTSFDEAVANLGRFPGMAGIGIMFAENGGMVGIDLDDCIVGGQYTKRAATIIRAFNSYTEVSPSRNGAKIWIRATKRVDRSKFEHPDLGCSRIEVYDANRYFTVTGDRVDDLSGFRVSPAIEERQDVLDRFTNWALGLTSPKSGVADAPSVAANSTTPTTTPPPSPPAPSATPPAVLQKFWNYLAKIGPAISGKGGHDRTFRAARECFKFGLRDHEAFQVLAQWNMTCQPPWTAEELNHKLSDAKKKVVLDGEFGIRAKVFQVPVAAHRDLPKWISGLPGVGPFKISLYQRTILQTIANGCRPDPVDAFGSLGYHVIGMETIAQQARMSLRTVQKHIPILESMGLLVVVERGGIDFVTGEIRANKYLIPGVMGMARPAADGAHATRSPTTPQTWTVVDRTACAA